MFEVKNLSLSYSLGQQKVEVLKNLNFKVKPGEFVGIQGPSGSGKSTLFYILGLLLEPTSGTIFFNGMDMANLSEDERAMIRNQKIGFIFQQFHLLPKTSSLQNILLPTQYPSEFSRHHQSALPRAMELAERLGLSHHLDHYPNQLSGGQQQRVAIARALINDIEFILADEPTGNLDSYNAQQILDLLVEFNRQGKTIILITHDSEVAKRCSKIYSLKDGLFTEVIQNDLIPSHLNRSLIESKKMEISPKAITPGVYRKIIQGVFPLVLENLLKNKIKSLLTMLGVLIGVATLLVVVTLGEFTKRKILETYEVMGVNKLLIRGFRNREIKATDQITVNFISFDWDQDILPLKKVFPEIRYLSPTLSSWRSRAIAGGVETVDNKVTALGVSPEYLAITNRSLQMGRNISPYHVKNRSPVCVIGFDIAQQLFQRINPLGQVLTINDRQNVFPCHIIGVLSPVSSNEDRSPPNLHVIVPYTYLQTVSSSWWASQIHDVSLQIRAGADVKKAGQKIKRYFEQKYGKSGRFYVDSDSQLISQMKKFLNIFTILLTSIALLSLVVGGIGINNMMLVSVTERIKEFGIRKALGATHRSLRIQVLMESLCLCITAGALGLFLGWVIYEFLIFGAAQWIPQLKFEWIFEPFAAVLSVFSMVAVGIASGFIPALRAEKLQVIEALRSE